ncbi:hypothetical protein E2320_002598, partial [Naja naja]
RNTNSPNYDNLHIPETIGNSIKFLKLSILKLWSRLTQSNPHEYLDEIGSHENLLKKLYKSSNVLQAKITKNEGTSLRTKSYLQRLKNHQNMVQRDHWLQKNPRKKDLAVRLPTKREGLAKTTGKLAEDQIKHNQHTVAEKWQKLAARQMPLATNTKIAKNKKKTHELEIQKEVATDISEPSDDKSLRSLESLKSHQKMVQEDHELGKKQREDLFLRFVTKRRQFAEKIGTLQGKQVKSTSHTMIQQWWKPARRQVALKVKMRRQVTPKAKITEKQKKTCELEIQEEVATEISEHSGDIGMRSKSLLEWLKSHHKIVQEDHKLGKKQTEENLFLRFLTKRRQFAENIGKRQGELEVEKEALCEISEEKVKRWPKMTLEEKITGKKEKTHELEIQKEGSTEISEALKVERWTKVTLKEKIRRNRLKNHELEIQKEGSTETSEALKVERWTKVTLKEKIQENRLKTHKLDIQKETPTEISEPLKMKRWPIVTLKEEIQGNRLKTYELEIQKEAPVERLKWHQRKMQEDLEVGRNAREKTGKSVALLDAQRVSSLKRLAQASVHSLQKRSILHLPTELPPLTTSVVVDGGSEEQPGKLVFILKSGKRSASPNHVKHIIISEQAKEKNNEQIAEKLLEKELEKEQESKENLLRHLIIGGSNSRIPAEESETLNELLPDKTLSNEANWEYQEETTFAPLNTDVLSSTDNYFLQGDAFEAEVQKQLAHLILNVPMRNLIAHLIRIIKVNCRELATQNSCAFLIARMGLGMKLFNKRKNMKEASALLKSYLFLTKNETNITTASSRKMKKPSDEIPKQGIRQYGNNINWRLAVSVTTVMVVVILIICLIEIRSHQTSKGTDGMPPVKRTFLDRQKKDTPENQTSAISVERSPWLKDIYHSLDKIWKKRSSDAFHVEESSEEEEIFNRDNARPPEIPGPLPLEVMEILPPPPVATEPPALSLPPSEPPAPAPAPPPPAPPAPPAPPPPPPPPPAPAPEPVKKASSKKLSEKETATTETSPTTESEKETGTSEASPKTEGSETEGEGTEGTSKKTSSEEGDEEDEED